MFHIILQLHGSGGGKQSTSTKIEYNKYGNQVADAIIGGDYSNTGLLGNYLGQSQTLSQALGGMYGGLASTQLPYEQLLNNSVANTEFARNGLIGASQGNVSGFINNETNALQSVLKNTMGTNLNNWAQNGVINSSVATQGMNSIANQSAAQAAQNYNNAQSNMMNGYNSLMQNANANANNAVAMQNASQVAASNLGTDALSYLGAGNVFLGGQGGSTTTQSGGNSALTSVLSAGVAGLAACFTGDTKVATPYGEKEIKDVQVGDKILGFENNKVVTVEVIEVAEPKEQEIIEIVAEDEKGTRRFVETTATQPFMTATGDWIMAGKMPVGTRLKNAGRVTAVIIADRDLVYDLRVTNGNVYIANGYIAYGRF